MSWQLIRKALRTYWAEWHFFTKAKFKSEKNKNKDLLVIMRKKAHHLERCLFAPKAYPKDYAKQVAQELEKLLAKLPEGESPRVVAWGRKLLLEYQNRKEGETVYCPRAAAGCQREEAGMKTEDLMSLLRKRRSRRMFEKTPLTQEQKEILVESAQQAPASCNRQTVDLIFVEDPKLKQFVASTVPGGHQFFNQAPCIIIFVSNAFDYRYPDDRVNPYIDAAAGIENIYLAAETMGLGCCWGSYTSFGSVQKEAEVRRRLRIPQDYLIVASLAIGKSKQCVCEIPRDPVSKRYWNNYYGEK